MNDSAPARPPAIGGASSPSRRGQRAPDPSRSRRFRRSHQPRRWAAGSARIVLPGLLVLLGLLGAGCEGKSDNVACIFSPGCDTSSNEGGTEGSLGAGVPPSNGTVLRDGAPSLEAAFPTGTGAHSETPIVLVFSETIDRDSTMSAIVLVSIDPMTQVASSPLTVTQRLLGDGQVLVLYPDATQPLQSGLVHEVRLLLGATLRDLTGQALPRPDNDVFLRFTVAATDPVEPSVVTSFPPDAGVRESTVGEILVVFDRPMDPSTFVADVSFEVTVDSLPPTFNPDPEAVGDTRVFAYPRFDPLAESLSPFAGSGAVEVHLSGGSPLLDQSGEALPETFLNFDLATVGAPLTSAIVSDPSDAIGIASLTPADPGELTVEVSFDTDADGIVELEDVADGDRLDLFLFGQGLAEGEGIIALEPTTVALDGTANPVTLNLANIDLNANPAGTARLADGTVTFAFRHRRGNSVSAVQVLDTDATASGIQDPLVDTVAPTFEFDPAISMPTGSPLDATLSDVRDLVIFGRASEVLRRARVATTSLATNLDNEVVMGEDAPVVGSNGFEFVAAPVPLGVLDRLVDPTVDYEVTIFDTALNSATTTGTFTQVGGVGSGAPNFLAPGVIVVEVRDAETLDPIPSAFVWSHKEEDDGMMGILTTQIDFAMTDANGLALVAHHVDPEFRTSITVEAPGYSLFTFHEVTAIALSVLLEPTAATSGESTAEISVLAGVQSAFDTANTNVRVGDSRVGRLASKTLATTCAFNIFVPDCDVDVPSLTTGRFGAQSLIGTRMGSLAADSLIRAFELQFPLGAIADGEDQPVGHRVARTFQDLESELFGPLNASIDITGTTGLGGMGGVMLESDADFGATPLVTVDLVVPGMAQSATVGIGVATDDGMGGWDVVTTYPLEVEDIGTDLRLRAELRDVTDGLPVPDIATVRPTVASLVDGVILLPPDVPSLSSPAVASMGASFDLTFADTLGGAPGLYRVQLTDSTGRSWNLWTASTGTDPVRLHVPALEDGAMMPIDPLADGTVEASITAWRVPGFDPSEFLWTDLEREFETRAHGVGSSFSKP